MTMPSPRIVRVRPVLLSAPYADARTDLEVLLHLPSGWRTTGLVEITLDNGVVGLGEGYLAVFAPRVFETIVELVAPTLIGQTRRTSTACAVTWPWSRATGACRARRSMC
jgi:L-alanine-DL-glutamate epimerase-like enolase superfamily enzyme